MGENFKARGLDAAAAYLERIGMRVVERNYETPTGTVPLIATDGNVLVRVRVATGSGSGFDMKPPSDKIIRMHRKQMDDYIATIPGAVDVQVRFDDVHIRVLAQDRALLRHFRGAYGNESEA